MQTNDEPKEKAFSFRVDTTGLKQVHREGWIEISWEMIPTLIQHEF